MQYYWDLELKVFEYALEHLEPLHDGNGDKPCIFHDSLCQFAEFFSNTCTASVELVIVPDLSLERFDKAARILLMSLPSSCAFVFALPLLLL